MKTDLPREKLFRWKSVKHMGITSQERAFYVKLGLRGIKKDAFDMEKQKHNGRMRKSLSGKELLHG